MPTSNEFLALLLVLFVAVEVAVVWLLWQAALTVPKPFRMRWPWTLWLLLLPIISTILAFFILLPLAKSYHRYFSHEKWPGCGERGYGSAMAIAAFFWLSWVGRVYAGNLTFATRSLHLLGPVPLVQISRFTGMSNGLTVVVAAVAVGLLVCWLVAKRRRRYFAPEKWLGRGCYGTVVATGILTWLSLMEYVPRPGPATIKRWSHLPALVHQAHIAGSWTAAGAGIGWLAMVIIMLDLRNQSRRMQQRAKSQGTAEAALAWLENNASQPQAEVPADNAPP